MYNEFSYVYIIQGDEMNVVEAIQKRRTIRRFKQEPLERESLIEIIDSARVAPMGANIQFLKYRIVDKKTIVKDILKYVKWASYLGDEGAPHLNQSPVAFIVVLADSSIKKAGGDVEVGAAVQNMLLTATSKGIGTCWMGTINRTEISKLLKIELPYILMFVVALGYPSETPETEVYSNSFKYYKDEGQVLHVPKLSLEDILLSNEE